MKYISTVRVESVAMPGVFLTVRKPSYQKRCEMDLETAACRQELRKIGRKLSPLLADYETNKNEIDDGVEEIRLRTAVSIDPLWLRKCFLNVDGLEIDGKDDPTIEDILAAGSDLPIIKELIELCQSGSILSAADAKNLPSPSTSPVQEATTIQHTTAINVNEAESTEPVLVGDLTAI